MYQKLRTGMYLMEIRWWAVAWMHLSQDTDWWLALQNTAMNLRVP